MLGMLNKTIAADKLRIQTHESISSLEMMPARGRKLCAAIQSKYLIQGE